MDATAGESSEFGEQLRAHREAAGLTQEELAERAGLTAQGVGALERGDRRRPYPHTVRSLADALGLSEYERTRLSRATPKRGSVASPLQTATTPMLPVSPRPLLGREREINDLRDMLGRPEPRLLTLTGTGGVGKTRLAIEVATEVTAVFQDGVAFVSLASLADPALVVPTVAQALGLREAAGRTVCDVLHTSLRDKHMLLVLDNFEHVLDAAPEVADLLATSTRLRVLATSRAPLRLRSEQEYLVAPLALPQPNGTSEIAATIEASAAVALFVERAQATDPTFALTDQNAVAVAEVCRWLDGVPLAIELAAARIKLFTPHALLSRLTNRLWLLIGGARDLPDRQRTMRDAIAWSHDLLAPNEQALFRRLAVFAGGFDLDAAEAVCGSWRVTHSPSPITPDPSHSAFEGIASLFDNSMLVRSMGPGRETRFRMLETIREYALEQLAASGEAESIRQAHADFFLALAEQADAHLLEPSQAAWLERLEAEHDNMRVALAWADDQRQPEVLLRLAGALARFWRFHWHRSEGSRWLERALAWDNTAPTTWRAKALIGAGVMANMGRDYLKAATLHREALAMYRELGDRWATARALMHLGEALGGQGDTEQARVLFEESLTLFRDLGEEPLATLVLKNLGQLANRRGDITQATELLKEALELSKEAEFAWGRAEVLMLLGDVTRDRDDQAQASSMFAEALALYGEQGDKEGMARTLGALAAIAGECGRPERAARLFGAAASLHEAAGLDPATSLPGEADFPPVLDVMAFADVITAGRELGVQEALEEAASLAAELERESVTMRTQVSDSPPAGLTPREVDVLRLVAAGLTNNEIADRLFLSRRTVDTHLQRIYGKLGASGRAAATRFAVKQGLV
jgi:predicted ATPase/DNA-binding CsgD family transcriptional regulator/DNA-binding XRE family transcriptional regulator